MFGAHRARLAGAARDTLVEGGLRGHFAAADILRTELGTFLSRQLSHVTDIIATACVMNRGGEMSPWFGKTLTYVL